jgi:hypothetical protein
MVGCLVGATSIELTGLFAVEREKRHSARVGYAEKSFSLAFGIARSSRAKPLGQQGVRKNQPLSGASSGAKLLFGFQYPKNNRLLWLRGLDLADPDIRLLRRSSHHETQ